MNRILDNIMPLCLAASAVAALYIAPETGAWGWFLLGALIVTDWSK